jgi:hypothetical protein
MDITERSHDVISGSNQLEDLYILPDFPVFMGSVLHDSKYDLRFDMAWSISKDTGIIQLKKLLPLDLLYQSQTTTSAVGALWMEHHRAFAAFLSQYKPAAVLELGGAHGILAKEYEKYAAIPWTILEPNPVPTEGSKATFIKGFFDDRFILDKPIDTVIHSHVYEHLYEPDKFTRHLAGFIKEGQRMIFAVPHLLAWLDKKYTNCINFEHTVFLTEPYIEHLLSKHGFRLENKSFFKTEHSIFYSCIRDSLVKQTQLDPDLYATNKLLYENFVGYHQSLIADLNERISETDKPVFLFGAHVFAQYLIAFGLRTEKITGLLDNDAQKQGKRLYGTNLIVHSPNVLRDILQPAVILKAGVYNDEIKADILKNINDSTEFFE